MSRFLTLNELVEYVQCQKGHALVIPKAGNNSCQITDFMNININGRHDGGSSNIIKVTSHSSNIAANDSIIINDPLRGKGS